MYLSPDGPNRGRTGLGLILFTPCGVPVVGNLHISSVVEGIYWNQQGGWMSRRVKVKEPPREGEPGRARFHLKDGWELIGWTNDYAVAQEWLEGFGPGTSVSIEDRQSWAPKVVNGTA